MFRYKVRNVFVSSHNHNGTHEKPCNNKSLKLSSALLRIFDFQDCPSRVEVVSRVIFMFIKTLPWHRGSRITCLTLHLKWQNVQQRVSLRSRMCVPGSYRSHSCAAQWEWSCWVGSAQAQTEQRERWLHTVAEARKYLAKDKHHTSVLASCGTSFGLNLDLFGWALCHNVGGWKRDACPTFQTETALPF